MPEYDKRLKNKNEFQGIQKKISKIQYYLSRVEQDMKLITKKNKIKQWKRLQERLDLIRRSSQQELRKISADISRKIAVHEENSTKISMRLSQLKQQQAYNRETINLLKQKLTAIETELGQ